MSTVQVTLAWASWAVPSLPARLAAAELAKAVPCTVTEVDFSLGMLSPDLETFSREGAGDEGIAPSDSDTSALGAAPHALAPNVEPPGTQPSHASLLRDLLAVYGAALPLPIWIISVEGVDDHRVLHGAVPKFEVREAIDDLLGTGV